MSTVTANVAFHARYIRTIPQVAPAELNITHVTVDVRPFTIEALGSPSFEDGVVFQGWLPATTLQLLNNVYSGTIQGLEQNKKYEIKINVHAQGTVYQNQRRMFLDTADTTKYYSADLNIIAPTGHFSWGPNDDIINAVNPKLTLIPTAGINFPLWTPGLHVNGAAIAQPEESAIVNFRNYATTETSSGVITLVMPLIRLDRNTLIVEFGRLKAGTYGVSYADDNNFVNQGSLGTLSITTANVQRNYNLTRS
jgi:hypothetical protein